MKFHFVKDRILYFLYCIHLLFMDWKITNNVREPLERTSQIDYIILFITSLLQTKHTDTPLNAMPWNSIQCSMYNILVLTPWVDNIITHIETKLVPIVWKPPSCRLKYESQFYNYRYLGSYSYPSYPKSTPSSSTPTPSLASTQPRPYPPAPPSQIPRIHPHPSVPTHSPTTCSIPSHIISYVVHNLTFLTQLVDTLQWDVMPPTESSTTVCGWGQLMCDIAMGAASRTKPRCPWRWHARRNINTGSKCQAKDIEMSVMPSLGRVAGTRDIQHHSKHKSRIRPWGFRPRKVTQVIGIAGTRYWNTLSNYISIHNPSKNKT